MGRSASLSLRHACLIAAFATPAWGAKWDIVPTLAVEETYTDNLRLSPAGAQRSDWVTQLRPGISVAATGAELRLDARYGLQVLQRWRDKSDAVFHQLDAKANAELVRKLIFIDAAATVSQQNVSLLGPQAASNVNITGNRSSVGTFSLSPYLRRDLGATAKIEARYTRSTVSSNAPAEASVDSDSDRFDVQLSSGPAYRLLTWNLGYSSEQIQYHQARDVRTETLTAGLKRLVTPTLGVRVNAGYDRNNYVTTGPKPEGASWSIGPEWTPTTRTRLSATAGER